MMCLFSRRKLASALAPRYQDARKSEKTAILDEFVQNSGFHRKYAVSVLRAAAAPNKPLLKGSSPRHRRRKYGLDIEQPFMKLWRVSGGLCPKRLVPFLPYLVESLERFNEFDECPHVRERLLEMSVSTAERMLARALRARERGISTTLPGTLLRHQIPIRTFEEWSECCPGFMEIDLVAHCGGTASGDYAYTLTMTDIQTGWTECFALANRSQITVEAAIEVIRKRLPFPLFGIDSDNGAEFINWAMKGYCDDHNITFTRCRPYKKNDQCHVEQKNGAVVRSLVGYARYEGAEAVAYLNRIYAKHRLSVNFFEPSMKLVSKSRTGARVTKKYDAAKTPWQRLIGSGMLSNNNKDYLTKRYQGINPAQLRRDLDELEMGLRRFTVTGPEPAAVAPEQGCANPTAGTTQELAADASREASVAAVGASSPIIQGPVRRASISGAVAADSAACTGADHVLARAGGYAIG
jgi:hypothetical protein